MVRYTIFIFRLFGHETYLNILVFWENKKILRNIWFIVQNTKIIIKVRILFFTSPISALFSGLVQNKIRVTFIPYNHIQFKLTKFRFISIQLNNCLRTIKWRIFITVLIRFKIINWHQKRDQRFAHWHCIPSVASWTRFYLLGSTASYGMGGRATRIYLKQ